MAKFYSYIWNTFFVVFFVGFAVVQSEHALGHQLVVDESAVQRGFTEALDGFDGQGEKSGIYIKYTGLVSLAQAPSKGVPSFVITEMNSEGDVLLKQEKYLLSKFRYSSDQRQIEGFDLARVSPKSQDGESGVLRLYKQKNHWIELDRVDRTLGQKKLRFSLNAKQAAQVTTLLGKLQNRME